MREEEENGHYKLSVENRMTSLEVTVSEIKNNHLPHLEAKMDKILWLVITTLAGVAVQFLMMIAAKL